jgi:hypothetical protein
MIEETELYLKLEFLKTNIPKNEWKYYRLLQIENFIYHLKNIKNERTREKAADDINDFLGFALEKSTELLSPIEKGKALFPVFWRLCDLYTYELGFIRKPDIIITSVIFSFLFIFFRFFYNNSAAFVITFCFFLLYMFYAYPKLKAKKVY